MKTNQKLQIEKLVLGAVMTALVIIFQLIGTFTAFFGPFSTAVALIPIVIGAAMCGVGIGGWLGLVFGIVVLASGGAALFMAYDIPGTIVTVLVKGLACGLAAGAVYKLLCKFNEFFAVLAAAVVCPVVNTGCFLLGCLCFFMDSADAIAAQLGGGVSGMDLFWALAMANFLIELGSNILLSPIIVRLLRLKKKV
jgi:uncharacterized membrane protein